MELFVLADVDYEDFAIIGVFSTPEKAMEKVKGLKPDGKVFWIERWGLDEAPVTYIHWTRKADEEWVMKSST